MRRGRVLGLYTGGPGVWGWVWTERAGGGCAWSLPGGVGCWDINGLHEDGRTGRSEGWDSSRLEGRSLGWAAQLVMSICACWELRTAWPGCTKIVVWRK